MLRQQCAVANRSTPRRRPDTTSDRCGRNLDEILQRFAERDGPEGKTYGRNLTQLEFELVEEIKLDPTIANNARRTNLIKANAARARVN